MSGENKKPCGVMFDYPARVESVDWLGQGSKKVVEVVLRPSGINRACPVRILLTNMPELPEIHVGEELRISVQKFD